MKKEVIIVVVIVAVFFVFELLLKKKISQSLIIYLYRKDFSSYYQIIDSFLVKFLFLPFNRENMRLNGYLVENNKIKIDEQFETMSNFLVTPKQREDILTKAFFYYIDERNKERCTYYLNLINQLKNKLPKISAQLAYDVYILKKSNHIDQIENNLKQETNPVIRKSYLLLLKEQYINNGNDEKSREIDLRLQEHEK